MEMSNPVILSAAKNRINTKSEYNPTGYAIPHFIRNDTSGGGAVILSAAKNRIPNKSRVPPDS